MQKARAMRLSAPPSVPPGPSLPGRGSLASCAAEAQGNRPSMEDAHVRVDSLWSLMGTHGTMEYPRAAFYAVYDGHGGARAAKVAEACLHNEVAKRLFQLGPVALRDEELVRDVLIEAFARTEAEVVARATTPNARWEDGCTACAVLVLGDMLYSANLGDSRAVLSRSGTAHALTVDHKPGTKSETRRIMRAGGYVRTVMGIDRVMGDLSVSRAFGDIEYKPNIISAIPEVSVVELNETDEFFVIGCDGLWDVLSGQEVVDETHKLFKREHAAVASRLVDMALCMPDCDDNVSVVVVAFAPFLERLAPPSAPRAEADGARLYAGKHGRAAGGRPAVAPARVGPALLPRSHSVGALPSSAHPGCKLRSPGSTPPPRSGTSKAAVTPPSQTSGYSVRPAAMPASKMAPIGSGRSHAHQAQRPAHP